MSIQPPDAVIVAAVRTPVGAFQGSLSALSATQLGGAAIRGVHFVYVVPVAGFDRVLQCARARCQRRNQMCVQGVHMLRLTEYVCCSRC